MIGKRIEEYLAVKRYKVKELAKIIGISQGSLSDIKNGNTEPRADTLEKIVRNTDISAHWLLTGEGPMTRHDEAQRISEAVHHVRGAQDLLEPEIQDLVNDLIDILRSDDMVMKTAITQNVKAFKESVSRKDKLERADIETDFKTAGSQRVSRQPGAKHRVGGE